LYDKKFSGFFIVIHT